MQPGELVGVIDLLRQSPCEAAIARQPCRLLSLPLKVILDLLKDVQACSMACKHYKAPAKAGRTSQNLGKVEPPPTDTQGWFLEQLEAAAACGSSEDSAQQLLSSVLPGAEKRVGCVLTSEEQLHLSGSSNLPLRFWGWTASAKRIN